MIRLARWEATPLSNEPILVRDVMVTDVQCCAAEDSLRDALEIMLEQGLTTLPVVDPSQNCVGVIAAVDLLAPSDDDLEEDVRRLTNQSGDEQTYVAETVETRGLAAHAVEDFMSSRVVAVAPDTELHKAAGIMLKNQIHHLVVIDAQDKIIGILSTMDILEVYANEGQVSEAQ